MANSNTLPWLVAVVATAVGAGAIGFFARPYIVADGQVVAQQTRPATEATRELPPNTTTEKFGAWDVLCQQVPSGTNICLAAYDAKTERGELVMNLIAGYAPNGEKTLLVRTPLGVQIDKGLSFRMPTGNPIAFAFTACSRDSCDAQLSLPEDGYKKLEEAGSFELSYEIAGAEPIKAMIPMDGLTAAYGKVTRPVPPAPAAATPAPAAETDAPTPTPKPSTP